MWAAVIVLRAKNSRQAVVVLVATGIAVAALSPVPMPFVGPLLSQGGFVPSAYLLTALVSWVSLAVSRDVGFPVTVLAGEVRRLGERLIAMGLTCVAALIVVALAWLRLGGYAHPDVLLRYAAFFVGLGWVLGAITTTLVSTTAVLGSMLLLFAVAPVGQLNDVLFTPDAVLPDVTSALVFLVGAALALGRGLDRRSVADLVGVNDR